MPFASWIRIDSYVCSGSLMVKPYTAPVLYEKTSSFDIESMLVIAATDDDAVNLYETLDLDEQTIINDLLDEIGADAAWKQSFLKWLSVDSVEAIPSKRFQDAKSYLEGIRDGDS